MLQAIKVGKRRIIVNNIREVEVDDYYASRDSAPSGIKVTIHFTDGTDSIELGDKEGRDFLRQFDALTGIAETDAVAEPVAAPVAAPETGTLRDALPFLYTVGLRDFNYLLTDIVNSAAPESAKVEAKKLKLFTDEELEKRKALALKQRESLLKR